MQDFLGAVVKFAIYLRPYGLAEMAGDLPIFIQLNGPDLDNLEGKVRVFLRLAVGALIPLQVNDYIGYGYSLLSDFCCPPLCRRASLLV